MILIAFTWLGMWWTVFPGCRKSAATLSSCCAISWSSTNNTFANAATTCRKSGTGLGLTDESSRSKLRLQQPEELSLRDWGSPAKRSTRLYLGGEDRVGR